MIPNATEVHAMARLDRRSANILVTRTILIFAIVLCFFGVLVVQAVAEQSPTDAINAFQLSDDRLVVELVAAEPDVYDPVAMSFDEDGRLYVVELRGFQLGADGEDGSQLGRVRLLEDRDADGRFEVSTVFAERLTLPTAVIPVYGGILVGAAPDLIYMKDTDGDGRADIRQVLFTGFAHPNVESLLNSLHWGLDNWIWGCGSRSGGKVYPADHPHAAKVVIDDFRVLLRQPRGATSADSIFSETRLAAASGGGQFGMTADSWGRRFSTSNSNHVMHTPLPHRYLQRNPFLSVSKVCQSCSDHGAGCQVFRISPLEPWREARRKQRIASGVGDATPAGFLTAGSGALIYDGDALPEEYRGDAFVAAAANNLVHRDVLSECGATFIAQRATRKQDRDFLASPSVSFRPVAFGSGPDGALYVVDVHRGVIETPLSVPPDIRKTVDWKQGDDQGRIYRIRGKAAPSRRFQPLGGVASADLVPLLAHANGWHRITAQRLIVERQDRSVTEALSNMAVKNDNPLARLHALCTLDGLSALDEELVAGRLNDPSAGVRQHALRLAEDHLADPSLELIRSVLALLDDPSAHVRFQLAFTLGFLAPSDEVLSTMARLAERDSHDYWCRTALLSSTAKCAFPLWKTFHKEDVSILAKQSVGATELVRSLVQSITVQGNDNEVATILSDVTEPREANDTWWQLAALEGLTAGAKHSGAAKRLSQGQATPALIVKLLTDDRQTIRLAARRLAMQLDWQDRTDFNAYLAQETDVASDEVRSLQERIEAITFLGCGSFEQVGETLENLLIATEPIEIQKAAIGSIARLNHPEAAAALLTAWRTGTPALKQAVMQAISVRSIYLQALLIAVQDEEVPAWAIDSGLKERLTQHKDPEISRLAKQVLSSGGQENQQVFTRYQTELDRLDWKGDPQRGRDVFQANCASCHQYAGLGHAVGPDLKTVVSRPPEQLLGDILLPSQSITVGYEFYLVQTVDGYILSGTIAGESATSITLKMQDGKERTLLRTDIEEMTSAQSSMMPDNLHKEIPPQRMADLFAFIKTPQDASETRKALP